MKQIQTKEKSIKKAKKLQSLMKFQLGLVKILKPKSGVDKKEIHIETETGSARILFYGANDPRTLPVFFDLHGGGFVLGNAEMDEAMNTEIFQKIPCKIVSIDYAKAPDFPYPFAVEQIYSVIKHFHENAEKYGIDNEKMAIGGHSAGGNLSTVICLKAKELKEFSLKCQILDFPPLDLLTDPYEKPQPKGSISPSMATVFNDSYADKENAGNPYVSPVFADIEMLKELPPALIILAGRDSLYNEGKKYIELLKDAGVSVTEREYKNVKHGFTYGKSRERDEAVSIMIDFLREGLAR